MKKQKLPAAVREALGRGEVKPSLIDKAKKASNDDLYVDPYEEFEEKEMPAEAAAKFREDLSHVPHLASLRKRATADPAAPRDASAPRMSPAVRVQHFEEKIARRPLTEKLDCYHFVTLRSERDLLESNATCLDIEVEFATLPDDECMTVARFEREFKTLHKKATGAGGALAYYWGERDLDLVLCLCLDEDRETVAQYYYLPGV